MKEADGQIRFTVDFHHVWGCFALRIKWIVKMLSHRGDAAFLAQSERQSGVFCDFKDVVMLACHVDSQAALA